MIKKLSKYALPVGIWLGIIGLVLLALSILWIVFDGNYFRCFTGINASAASNLGQFIGGFVGVFLSGAGFFLIYSTFIEQSRFNTNQVEHNSRMNFESKFFQLLQSYHEIVKEINGTVKINPSTAAKEFQGRYFISAFLKNYKSGLTIKFLEYIDGKWEIPEVETINKRNESVAQEKYLNSFTQIQGELSKPFWMALFDYTVKDYISVLSHYFRILTKIITICAENKTYKEVKYYLEMIESQMSDDELGLLYYFAMSDYSTNKNWENKLYDFLNEYDFFENIYMDTLIHPQHHWYYSTIFKFLPQEIKDEKSKMKIKSKFPIKN